MAPAQKVVADVRDTLRMDFPLEAWGPSAIRSLIR